MFIFEIRDKAITYVLKAIISFTHNNSIIIEIYKT